MIAGAQALWWLALPLLLLPVWWHRQKRQRIKSEALATARFLPSAPPQQLRVWRWDDPLLLLVRCLLLLAVIAWLAAVTIPWRGDTVLIDPALADPALEGAAWTEQQIAAAGLSGAQRMPLPAEALSWLQAHEYEWRPGARLMIVTSSLPLPARLPRLAHAVDIRIRPTAAAPATVPAAPSAPAERHVVLATSPERMAAWRALFAAFSTAGGGAHRYVLGDAPAAGTELIVWDKPEPMPSSWRAPLWWIGNATATPALAEAKPKPLTVNGIALKIADTPSGRMWSSDAWPPQDAEAAATLYETWQALARPAPPYAAPAMTLPAQRKAALSMPGTPPAEWLAYVMLALFVLERILTHARRR